MTTPLILWPAHLEHEVPSRLAQGHAVLLSCCCAHLVHLDTLTDVACRLIPRLVPAEPPCVQPVELLFCYFEPLTGLLGVKLAWQPKAAALPAVGALITASIKFGKISSCKLLSRLEPSVGEYGRCKGPIRVGRIFGLIVLHPTLGGGEKRVMGQARRSPLDASDTFSPPADSTATMLGGLIR